MSNVEQLKPCPACGYKMRWDEDHRRLFCIHPRGAKNEYSGKPYYCYNGVVMAATKQYATEDFNVQPRIDALEESLAEMVGYAKERREFWEPDTFMYKEMGKEIDKAKALLKKEGDK